MTVGELIDSLFDVPLNAEVFMRDFHELTGVRYDSADNTLTMEDE